jgi:hypothetical protein
MGFFKKILGGESGMPEGDERQRAKNLLQDVVSLSKQDPKKAMKKLRKEAKPFYGVLRIGEPLNSWLQGVMVSIWERESGGKALTLPTAEAVPWSTWGDLKMSDIMSKAMEIDKDVLYCTAEKSRSLRDAIGEIEALRLFADDEKVAMVIIGEKDMLFRKSFLMRASQAVKPDSEDIGQDLMDYAKKIGLKTEYA